MVKPQVGKEGVTGLGTLLSGAYIELQPGLTGKEQDEFNLLDSPPLASPDAKGIRINLVSERAGQLNAGDPVLFRGYQVGSVETSEFNIESRDMHYQLLSKHLMTKWSRRMFVSGKIQALHLICHHQGFVLKWLRFPHCLAVG